MKTTIKKLLMVLMLVPLVNISCKKDPLGPTVYLAGRFVTDINNGSYNHAAYWENGKMYPLDESAVESEARAIEVEDGKVYVAGRIDYKPCIWVEGQKKELSALEGMALGLQVKAGVAYISGYTRTNQLDSYRAQLWMLNPDGQLTQVPLENEMSYAAELIFVEESLLITGVHKMAPCYWKWTPASKTRIDLGPKKGTNRQPAVYKNEVYISGAYDTDNDGQLPYKIGYWKGTNFISLGVDLNPNTEFESGLAFDEAGQLYLTANLHGEPGKVAAHYYKNGQQIKLSDQAVAHGIAIFNKDVYVAGSTYKDAEEQVCYWKNGALRLIKTARSTAMDIEIIN